MILRHTNSNPTQISSVAELKYQLKQQLIQSRADTLALFEGIDYPTFCRQVHPEFSPIGWHLGHIGFTEALWLLEHCAGLPAPFPHYRRLFAVDSLPKHERTALPPLEEVLAYLNAVRTQVFQYLAEAPLEQQEWLWRWLIQHESQHSETISWVLHLQRPSTAWIGPLSSGPLWTDGILRKRATSRQMTHTPEPNNAEPEMIRIEAGWFEQGNDSIDALDNEQQVHPVYLETYWIDRYPVTRRQYQMFIEAGGYTNPNWWSREGWAWLQTNPISQPLYWNLTQAEDHPVYGVSWYEAEAYAHFAGKRLPTESEWEKAASWNPTTGKRQTYPWGEGKLTPQHCNHSHKVGQTTSVGDYRLGKSAYGCCDMVGNVWEWTASWFYPYDGFASYPYTGYSTPYFDQQHRVLKGGSWATRASVLRCAFRNWYYPGMRELFSGFRCARSENGRGAT